MERRELLKIVALTALSPRLSALQEIACHSGSGSPRAAADAKLQFFTAGENAILDQLMEMIIPADPHSPGAHAANTSLFADLIVSTGDDALKKQWRDGISLMREEASRSSLAEVLQKAAANEADPRTELDRFFILLKRMTVDAYYTSEIGIHKDLAYDGNTYLPGFSGCTHAEHDE